MKRARATIDPPPPRGDIDKPGHHVWMVASPDGTLHLTDKEAGKVFWGHQTGRGIYNAERQESTKDYIDLGTEENDTDMYRYRPGSGWPNKLVCYKDKEDLEAYINLVYAETSMVSKTDSEFYLEYQTGERLPVRTKDALAVKRTDYLIVKNLPNFWSLRYSKFVVSFPSESETEGIRCVVRHTRNFNEFAKVCDDYRMSKIPVEGPFNTFVNRWRKIKLPYRPVTIAKGNNGTIFVRGLFEGHEVFVKVVKKTKVDLSSVIQNYWSVNHHVNIVNLHACENDLRFHYFAMEECKSCLADFIAECIRKTGVCYVEMKDKSMNIMRSFVAGVSHLHKRRIVHRNLNPRNILIYADTTAKICGFSNSICVLEGQTHAMATEVYVMGLILLHIMTDGKYIKFSDQPYVGSVDACEKSIMADNEDRIARLKDFIRDYPYNYEGYHLLLLIFVPLGKRPTALAVLLHPRFWNAFIRLSFLKDVSDYYMDGVPGKDASTDCVAKFGAFKGSVGKFAGPLRDIRNDVNHMKHGWDEESLEEQHRRKHPMMLMEVYDAVKPYSDLAKFKKYYNAKDAEGFITNINLPL